MRKSLTGIFAVISFVAFFAAMNSQALAVSGNGGVASFPDGKPMANLKVRITIRNADGSQNTRETDTNEFGVFWFPRSGGNVTKVEIGEGGNLYTFDRSLNTLPEVGGLVLPGTTGGDTLLDFNVGKADSKTSSLFRIGSESRGWGKKSNTALDLFDLTIYGGYGFTSGTAARSILDNGSTVTRADNDAGNLGGGKFGGKLRMALPESVVEVPGIWAFIGGERFFGRDGTGGKGDFHPGTPDGITDTSVHAELTYAVDFGIGYSIDCPGWDCQIGFSAGASIVGYNLKGMTDESSGGGVLDEFLDCDCVFAPMMGIWTYHPLTEINGVPINLIAGLDVRHIDMQSVSGMSSTVSSREYTFETWDFWDIDPYIGINVPLGPVYKAMPFSW